MWICDKLTNRRVVSTVFRLVKRWVVVNCAVIFCAIVTG